MNKRTDRLTATHIDLAVNLAASHGIAAGARVLHEQRIPLDVARRVLLRPWLRRQDGRHDYFAFTTRHFSNRSMTRA